MKEVRKCTVYVEICKSYLLSYKLYLLQCKS